MGLFHTIPVLIDFFSISRKKYLKCQLCYLPGQSSVGILKGGSCSDLSMARPSVGNSGDELTRQGLARASTQALGLGLVPWPVKQKYDLSQPPYLIALSDKSSYLKNPNRVTYSQMSPRPIDVIFLYGAIFMWGHFGGWSHPDYYIRGQSCGTWLVKKWPITQKSWSWSINKFPMEAKWTCSLVVTFVIQNRSQSVQRASSLSCSF